MDGASLELSMQCPQLNWKNHPERYPSMSRLSSMRIDWSLRNGCGAKVPRPWQIYTWARCTLYMARLCLVASYWYATQSERSVMVFPKGSPVRVTAGGLTTRACSTTSPNVGRALV